jgi:hypothetical protein
MEKKMSLGLDILTFILTSLPAFTGAADFSNRRTDVGQDGPPRTMFLFWHDPDLMIDICEPKAPRIEA